MEESDLHYENILSSVDLLIIFRNGLIEVKDREKVQKCLQDEQL
jgi:hypothetical protein